jgi:CheY-like chemotaxis protein
MVDLSNLVREIVPLIQAGIHEDVEVELALAADLPAIQADATQMQQIVVNLMLNGAEAIGKHQSGKVRVSTWSRDGVVSLEVSDTGCGMSQDVMAKVFDPLFTTKTAGHGLGMATVQGIVRSQQGAIALSSTPGGGTTVLVTLPVVEKVVEKKALASVASVPNRQQEPGAAGTILVVDDEKPVRMLFRKILERYGYEVLVAENGQIGADLFAENHERISLVILDWAMPVLSGPETLQRLQRVAPGVPVVVSSGYAETDAVGQCGSMIAGYLQKPFKPQQLLEQIQSVMRSAAQTPKGMQPFGLAPVSDESGPISKLRSA